MIQYEYGFTDIEVLIAAEEARTAKPRERSLKMQITLMTLRIVGFTGLCYLVFAVSAMYWSMK